MWPHGAFGSCRGCDYFEGNYSVVRTGIGQDSGGLNTVPIVDKRRSTETQCSSVKVTLGIVLCLCGCSSFSVG